MSDNDRLTGETPLPVGEREGPAAQGSHESITFVGARKRREGEGAPTAERPASDAPSPSQASGFGPSLSPAGRGETERTCVLSGRKDSRDALIRLALGPDGVVAPDVRAKAPGRGAWIGVDRATLEQAIAKGKLGKALARAFKTAVTVPADLAEQIEKALERATLDRLGLEARAGQLVTGTERIVDAARKGGVELLLHARDAAADGTRKLDQALRVGLGVEGSDLQGLAIPATRAILSMALGRENVVHLALVAPAAAARVNQALGRWRGYIGLDG